MLDTHWSEFLDLTDVLLSTRKKAWDRFEEIGLPKSKQEAFQYVRKEFHFPKPAENSDLELEPKNGLVFVDGFFKAEQSILPEKLVCLPIPQAFKSYGLFLQSRMAKVIKEETDPFAALNGAFQGVGVFIYLPPNTEAELDVTHIFTSELMATPRIHLYLGRGAKLKLKQVSEGKSGFSNTLFDFVLDQGADLNWVDYSEGDFQAIRGLVKKDARLKSVSLGNVLRTSLKVQLVEENAQTELYGLAQISDKTQTHFHALVEHVAPHCYSKQHFKSVLHDEARFSFEGKIYVHPEAQKTQAYQLNNNLILSDHAVANAKPNLEIFADDVKASHGATVGRLDQEELFYLRSRGLSLESAQKRLITGFSQEILDHA